MLAMTTALRVMTSHISVLHASASSPEHRAKNTAHDLAAHARSDAAYPTFRQRFDEAVLATRAGQQSIERALDAIANALRLLLRRVRAGRR